MRFLLTIPIVLTAGCVSSEPAKHPEITSLDDLPLNAVIVKRVSDVVCASKPFAKTPPVKKALAALKEKAAEAGGYNLYRVKYAKTGIIECGAFAGLSATGLLYRIDPVDSQD